MEEESSLTTPPAAQPSQADQEASSTARNIPVETSRPAGPSRGGRLKSQVNRGLARGKHAKEESGDAVLGGEDVAQLITRFEVHRHPTKMKEGELELIRDMYQVPDYVEFQLPRPTDQPT